jgi:hypothetical protein
MYVEEAQAAYDQACQYEREAENRLAEAKHAYQESIDRLRKAESDLDEGRGIFNRFRTSEDEYRADYSLIAIPGPEALMRNVAKYDVQEAVSHLQKILDVVSAYCDTPMVVGSSAGGYTGSGNDNYAPPTRREKERRMEKAMDDAGYRLRKDRPRKMPNPDILVRCKVCGRIPGLTCRCKPSVLPDVLKK